MDFLKALQTALLVLLSLSAQNLAAQNVPPVVTAQGNQMYCPGVPLNIVTDFNITDIDDTGANAVYIKITYPVFWFDQCTLTLNNTNPNITSNWDAANKVLTIQGVGGQNVPYAELIDAVKNVMFDTAANPNTGERIITISLGPANYSPVTGHYYLFVPSYGISWTDAQAAAAASTYFGLQGYLATITSQEEVYITSMYTLDNGWAGGSDAETPGTWKWVTGPEAGTIFWNGGVNGSSPNYAYWNTGEPGQGNYVHTTAINVGMPGSWYTLPVDGGLAPDISQGYYIEYGGMPGDNPSVQVLASVTISVPPISGLGNYNCGDGSVTLTAGNPGAYWYDSPVGGNLVGTGDPFITPPLTENTTFYVSLYDPSCPTGLRSPVSAIITEIPTFTVDPPEPICGSGSTLLSATPSPETAGIYWFTQPTGDAPFAWGNTVNSPVINTTTTFYVQAINMSCPSATREAVTVTVLAAPIPEPDMQVTFCNGQQETLNAGTPNASYLWSTGATTQNIVITQAGTYTVEITNGAGCPVIRTFIATTLPLPEIINVIVNATTATVIMADNTPGDYEYSLDGINYQNSNVFTKLKAGSHTAYAKSKNDCGTDSKDFTVIVIPKFFTPNNDAVNDVFAVEGMYLYPKTIITIFDRYGKAITQLHKNNQYWDGTFKGNNLPADDYWYVIKLDAETPEIKGHFSLVR